MSLIIGVLIYLMVSLRIPDLASVADYQPPETSVFLSDSGEILASCYRENRVVVPLSRMPALLPKAFVAAEDGRFFHHQGVDGWSVLRAIIHNISSGRKAQGGSTITQQVARALLLTSEKTYRRKIREAVLAYRIDRLLSKEAILHLYLNQIYLGEGAFGVEAAARTYFGKKAEALSLAEFSLLAGLPQAPSRYSPRRNLKLAKARQRYVLNRMAADGYISAEDARQAFNRTLSLAIDDPGRGPEQYFVDYVRQYIENRYGQEQLLTGGLTVYTTLNTEFQEIAARAVDNGIKKWRTRNPGKDRGELPQSSMVVLDVQSAQVKALVGGIQYGASQYNRVTQSRRQPGSAFKPIVYAAAFRGQFTPADLIVDEPLHLQGEDEGLFWEPRNFSGEFYGPTPLRTGLIKSRNIVTIKLLGEVGIEKVRALASQMGISSPLAQNLSLALGTSGISLLELTGAYTVFAAGGIYRLPVFVAKVVDRKGRVLETTQPQERRVLSANTAYLVTNLLQGVIEEGTGRRARGLGIDAAGKTGTTDRNQDAWFVGYTPELVAGVWLGFDHSGSLGEQETGGLAAAPVWREFMIGALTEHDSPRKTFQVPPGIKILPMNPETGKILTEHSEGAVWVAFDEEYVPEN
ncbi:MAG: penicillin-binding protein 1A [Proteobacteria bacterium]|nr:penicillin-binding protein 1A [Pseudomonadota bacterium]MBU1688220.1 penicillin-binding protein 1A [Pseudomonadota bacterium]